MPDEKKKSQQAQILEATNKIAGRLDVRDVKDQERDKKTDKMYEILVTGNGKPSMEQRVSAIEDWINGERKLIWILIGTMVTMMGGGIAWLINTMLQLRVLLEMAK